MGLFGAGRFGSGFNDFEGPVGVDVLQGLDDAAGPGDFDSLGDGFGTEAKVDRTERG